MEKYQKIYFIIQLFSVVILISALYSIYQISENERYLSYGMGSKYFKVIVCSDNNNMQEINIKNILEISINENDKIVFEPENDKILYVCGYEDINEDGIRIQKDSSAYRLKTNGGTYIDGKFYKIKGVYGKESPFYKENKQYIGVLPLSSFELCEGIFYMDSSEENVEQICQYLQKYDFTTEVQRLNVLSYRQSMRAALHNKMILMMLAGIVIMVSMMNILFHIIVQSSEKVIGIHILFGAKKTDFIIELWKNNWKGILSGNLAGVAIANVIIWICDYPIKIRIMAEGIILNIMIFGTIYVTQYMLGIRRKLRCR